MKMIKNKKVLIWCIVAVIVIAAIIISNTMVSKHTKVRMETNKGVMVLEIYTGEMPQTSGNFVKLVKEGFYDGVIFHRVIDGFMIQGGDPTGTGMGGHAAEYHKGYGNANNKNTWKIPDEFTNTNLDRNDRGTISMANAGPNTGGSQFFINLVDNNFLDGRHPVFGKIVEGIEVIDAIADVETDSQDKPVEDVVIIKATVL
mgnify:CR=1 FL=1